MKIIRRAALVAGAAVLAAATLPLLTTAASADTVPVWEPDPNALGTLTLFNASGTAVTGGSDLSHLFDYAEASTADAAAGTKVTMYFAQPTFGQATGNWPTTQASLSSTTPPTSAPSPLNTATDPVASVDSTYGNLQSFINAHTAQTQAGYQSVYQIRVVTTGGDNGGSNATGQYWDADVMVEGSSWVELYPSAGVAATATTTTLAAAPAAISKQGARVTLTATVSAADATKPAGSVTFLQDGQSLGTGTVNATTGIATLTTSKLLASAPSGTKLTATFTPTDASTYAPSTSAALKYTVNPVAKSPTISGPHKVGATEKCTEANLNFGVKATYTWLVNGKKAATGGSYKVAASAYKKKLSCSVTVKDGSGPASSAAVSKSVTVSLGAALKASKKPKLSGSGKVGGKEKVSTGKWSPAASSYSYQWYVGSSKINGATKSAYTLVSKDAGKKVACKVTAKKTGYAAGFAKSAAVKVKG